MKILISEEDVPKYDLPEEVLVAPSQGMINNHNYLFIVVMEWVLFEH